MDCSETPNLMSLRYVTIAVTDQNDTSNSADLLVQYDEGGM